MSRKSFDQSRRNVLRAGVAAVAAVSLGRLAIGGEAAAAELPKLSLDDPQAKALQYTNDASTVNNPAYQDGSKCSNCMHFQGKPDEEWGPCAIFPGKRVHRDGWCTAWAAQE